jgi:trigger factor
LDPEKETTEQPDSPATPERDATGASPEALDLAADSDVAMSDGMDEACKREISVEIPAEVVNREQDAIVKAYSREARVPGFRKGKVPDKVVRNRFSGAINNEVLESLVPQYFREAVIKGGFHPVSKPAIYALEAEPGQPVRFKAAFEILPDFELGAYRDVRVAKADVQVAAEEVDAELNRIRERHASFDPVDEERGARDGEFAQISFSAVPETTSPPVEPTGPAESVGEQGEPKELKEGQAAQAAAEPVRMNEVLVEIGGANTLPEFSENLRDVKPGEERSFQVRYPQDFHDSRLAGKVFHYDAKVAAVKKKTLPDMNDDFAREVNEEFQTLDQLRQRMQENMQLEKTHQAEHQAKEQLIEKLLEKHVFPVPRAMVEHQINLRLERGLRALAAQGMRTEDMRRMDFRRLRAGQREAAVKEVRSGLLLGKIADAENIQVTDEELEREIAALAQQMKQTPEEVRKRLADEGALERIRGRMRSEKALDFLYSRAE